MADDKSTINLKDPNGTGATGNSGGAQQTQQDDTKYNISDEVKAKYPQLVELIKATESMTDAEKIYWFQILPIMTDEQVDKLKKILTKEKEQLTKLDSEYEKELKRINDKHLIEWKDFETKKSREMRQREEAAADDEEAKAEEDILSKLNDV
ncbi:hypothetical protein COW94_04975 [Candidatus Peregrinibacteria bacterium CG22_combo_CG10-13_8_21_14_all_44_10]|nr:MAG: hypothetical protein AUK45_04320 [Candidatus Peregrinibacteria bacterium CG2_30_44_17]PIP65827.1 MAG: hypothetical protein COW94_04975 [Candidatus Peregrinibacteria bacterium CG22_combo_CG10-13_8_21_14_all_44_10]PIS04440.1 MAG: hypothetical protein COT83_00590 [Candidatus Peregrinibacteria bacterium CG10_big_fil_rev_8_21_14_0_10_44_7]PJB89451.1 MAG: hypothetical protein CO082_00945 [Candidatus Peregrinibacteria bacterium CG_4_9_14_0_8_um_filter_44_15]